MNFFRLWLNLNGYDRLAFNDIPEFDLENILAPEGDVLGSWKKMLSWRMAFNLQNFTQKVAQ